MKKFRVNFGVSYEVEAEDEKGAIQEAERILQADLSYSYAGDILGEDVEEVVEDKEDDIQNSISTK